MSLIKSAATLLISAGFISAALAQGDGQFGGADERDFARSAP